jgi:signal transduction histidine kinase/CheY-like chemotaxis protein
VSKIRLRTKFLLSLLAISVGLTSATLVTVGYRVRNQVRQGIREDLRNSANTYQSFEQQREEGLRRSAELLANLPNVRALMSTQDAATIRDASADIWRLSGSDLLVLANRAGKVAALRAHSADLTPDDAQQLLRATLERGESRDWWFDDGRLYKVWVQPIYFGAAFQDTAIGLLAVGHEVDARAAEDFSHVASSEVVFSYGAAPVATTLKPEEQAALTQQIHEGLRKLSIDSQEIQLGKERYLVASLRLSAADGPPVFLSVLKSFDKATQFLAELNNALIALGVLSVLAGSLLVFLISHTFTRPLASLVAGVRAFSQGDFSFPLESRGGDEVSEVTDAFIRMRQNVAKTQEDQKQLQDRLRQAHKMEAVGRLAGGVAHDFNNLLTIIRGNSDLLMDREGADNLHRRCVEQIQKAAGRAVSMTRQLLAFSRMQVLQPRVLELNAVVADMGKMLPRLIGEHIEFGFLPDSQQALVKADPGQLEQVIMNLAVNARDAMPNGGTLTVRSSVLAVEEAEAAQRPPMIPGRYVLLSVTDTGVGMDDATKAHIFEPFFTTKETGKGTGLGLATVYGVVKQSGGFIWVTSSPGKGATFEIYFPQASGPVYKMDLDTKPQAIPHSSDTVLVVEDEAGVRELACQFLKVKGYAVLEAKDGPEALEAAARYAGTIHLILSDMVMPKMSGMELVRRLKEIRPDVRVLFMSGYSVYSNGDPEKEFPDVPVLQKPFSSISLVEMVRKTIDAKVPEPVSDEKECRVP